VSKFNVQRLLATAMCCVYGVDCIWRRQRMTTMMMTLSALEAAEDGNNDEVFVSAGGG